MRLKRIITLGYPASRLPDDLRDELTTMARANVMIEEEACEGERADIEREVVVLRWVDGELVPAPIDGVPASLMETAS